MTDEEIDLLVSKMLAGEAIGFDDEVDARFGPPLTEDELRQGAERLARWQAPEAFSKDTLEMCERCSSPDYFNRPRLKFLHDAYVLAQFARRAGVDGVRLASPTEQWPDGYVRTLETTHNVEIVSEHGGRKLGEEYRKAQGLQFDPGSEWVKRARSIPDALDGAIRKKSDKLYASPFWLVVYLNINEYGIAQVETEEKIAAIKSRHQKSFSGLSILWKEKIY